MVLVLAAGGYGLLYPGEERVVAAVNVDATAVSEWFGGIDRHRPTGWIVAGLQPLPGVIGVNVGDLMLDLVGDAGFEQGVEE